MVDRLLPARGESAAPLRAGAAVALDDRVGVDERGGELVHALAATLALHTPRLEVPLAVELAVRVHLPQTVHQHEAAALLAGDRRGRSGQRHGESPVRRARAVAPDRVHVAPHSVLHAATPLELGRVVGTGQRDVRSGGRVGPSHVRSAHAAVVADLRVPEAVRHADARLGADLAANPGRRVHQRGLPGDLVLRLRVAGALAQVLLAPEPVEAAHTRHHVARRSGLAARPRLRAVVVLDAPHAVLRAHAVVADRLLPLPVEAAATRHRSAHTVVLHRFFAVGGVPHDAVLLAPSAVAVHVLDLLPLPRSAQSAQRSLVVAGQHRVLAVVRRGPGSLRFTVHRGQRIPHTAPSAHSLSHRIDHIVAVGGLVVGESVDRFFRTVASIAPRGEGRVEVGALRAVEGVGSDRTAQMRLHSHAHSRPIAIRTQSIRRGQHAIRHQRTNRRRSAGLLHEHMDQILGEGLQSNPAIWKRWLASPVIPVNSFLLNSAMSFSVRDRSLV